MSDTPAGSSEGAPASAPKLRLFRPHQPALALGLAVNHLMIKPAFANLKFGEWSRILVGQINRKHYAFAAGPNEKIVGFIGWALTTHALAEEWLNGNRVLSYEDSVAGDYVVFNAWSAETTQTHRFLVGEVRRIFRDKSALYFKRFYSDGRIRASRIDRNDFLDAHIRRRHPVA